MAIDYDYYFNNAQFGPTLKSSRQRRKLTLDQLSALTKEIDPTGEGVSKMTLSRYENGTTLPGLRELKILAFSLRVPLALLAYDDREDPMTSYRLNLEMRITETVMDMITAEGVIKGSDTQEPESPEYLALLDSVRNQQSDESDTK
jgi:transcriptional regulator with XRE-family HTH domain